MTTITLRLVKGTPLTNAEVDNNFSNLNSAKYESGASPDFVDTLTDKLSLDTTAAVAPGVGEFSWDDGNGTAQLGLKGGNTTLQIGQETLARVYNDSGVALTDGQIVYISGAQGNRVAVKLAKADSEATSAGTLGMVTEPIAIGAEGFITVVGTVNKLNTSALTAGNLLYLSATTAGAYTTTAPAAPNHRVTLGYVERVHATAGSIYVKVDNGYEIGELHDVVITTPSAGEVLLYNATSSIWENKAPSNISGLNASNLASGTVPTARLGTGTASTSTYLRGDQTWAVVPAPNNGTLTMAVSGTGLSGSATFTADQAGNTTFTVASNATSANTASTIVARDASGNFSAGTITATLSGNASTATNADQLDGQHGSYYQPASTAITTSNIGSQSVSYATSAGNADTLDGQHGAYYQPASTAITTSNIGSQSVNYASSAGSATSATQFMSTSHAGTYWLVNNWDGTYWSVTSNHGAGVRVARADSAGSASSASYATYLSGAPAYTNGYDGWWRSSGQAGWYNSDYSVGIYATEAGNVRTYNGANFISSGSLSATSDERLKTNWRPVDPDFVYKLAGVKSGVYDRTDNEYAKTQVGVSAQSLQTLLPEAILEDSSGILSVAYGNAALVAAVELAKEVVALRAELNALKEKVNGN